MADCDVLFVPGGAYAGAFHPVVTMSQNLLPFVIMLAAASFIYIALADLVPGMQRQNKRRESALQLLLLLAGIAAMAALTAQIHSH